MVELEINSVEVELSKDAAEITYTKQASDLFDLGSIANSYSNSISIAKTPNNTTLLGGLGLVGNTSRAPYGTIQTRLRDDGYYIIPKGYLTIKETAKDYKASITSGVIDLMKAIENKTMGLDVNLSNFAHEKNIDTVVDSFSNEYYTYIVADYNGKQLILDNGDIAINIDYLVPCFNMGQLLRAVFVSFDFVYVFDSMESLDELYITYPKPPSESVSEDLAAEMYKEGYVTTEKQLLFADIMYSPSKQPWTTQTASIGSFNGDTYIIPETGVYRIEFSVEAYVRYRVIGAYFPQPAKYSIYINDAEYSSVITNSLEPVESSFSIFLNQGDRVKRYLTARKSINGYNLYDFRTNSQNIKIYKTNQGNIDLSDAFKDFPVVDFIKECLWYTGSTMLQNPDTLEIYFRSISERLDYTQSVDWSDKFVERTSEKYIDSAFAQRNVFTHKYNEENVTYANGYLYVDNVNIPASKNLVNSRIYAPEPELFTFPNANGFDTVFNTPKYRTWNTEVKTDESDNVTVEYKGLSQRFYYIKKKNSPTSTWRLASNDVSSDSVTLPVIPIADSEGTTFDRIVPDRYSEYDFVLKDMRIHSFDLAIGAADFRNADLARPFYFEQEAAYYLMNKLTYKKSSLSTAECVKINRSVATLPPQQEQRQISIRTNVPDRLRFLMALEGYTIDAANSVVQISGIQYQPEDITYNPILSYFYINDIPGDIVVESFDILMNNGSSQRRYVFNGPPMPYGEIAINNAAIQIIIADIVNV